MPCKCAPARLNNAFQMNKRPLGRPNITVRHSFTIFQMLIQPVVSIVEHTSPSTNKDELS